VAGQPHPERAGPGLEDQRGIHQQRLAVDPDLHRGARADLETRRAPLVPAREAADLARGLERYELPGGGGVADPGRDDPQYAAVKPLPRPPAADVIKLVGIVRDQDHLGRRDIGAIGPGEPQVEGSRVPAQQIGQHRADRPELGVAVLGGLNHLGVEPERRVVHEHPAVDGGQVDRDIDPVAEGLQRAHHIVAVEAEVEREVVPGPGRDAHVRDAPAAGDGRDQRLRAVAAGHADHVGAAGDRVVGQPEQVVSRPQHDGLDAAPLALLGQPEPLGLPAAGLQVHDQNGMPGAPGPRQVLRACVQLAPGFSQRVTGRHHRQRCRDDEQDHVEQADVLQHQARAQHPYRGEHGDQADGADHAPPRHRVPACGDEDEHADERQQHGREMQHDADQQQEDGGRQGEQRRQGSRPLAERRTMRSVLGHAPTSC
jgi:hypothetical protein